MFYDVEFPDGEVEEYAANTIVENMYTQVDYEGYVHRLVDSIVDFKNYISAVERDDLCITTKSGRHRIPQTTTGWKLVVHLKDGSEEWIPLKELKDSNPLDVAGFATTQGIVNEPEFCWWVPYTLRQRDKIIHSINSQVKRVLHKYGVELLTSVKHSYSLDRQNKNTLWCGAINR